MIQQVHSWVYIQKKRYAHPSVHSGTIYNSQVREATQAPTNRWMD